MQPNQGLPQGTDDLGSPQLNSSVKVNEGEKQAEANMNRQGVGLRRTTLVISNSQHEQRLEKLQKEHGDYKFELVDHDTRKAIIVSGNDDLTPQVLEKMRRTARSI